MDRIEQQEASTDRVLRTTSTDARELQTAAQRRRSFEERLRENDAVSLLAHQLRASS